MTITRNHNCTFANGGIYTSLTVEGDDPGDVKDPIYASEVARHQYMTDNVFCVLTKAIAERLVPTLNQAVQAHDHVRRHHADQLDGRDVRWEDSACVETKCSLLGMDFNLEIVFSLESPVEPQLVNAIVAYHVGGEFLQAIAKYFGGALLEEEQAKLNGSLGHHGLGGGIEQLMAQFGAQGQGDGPIRITVPLGGPPPSDPSSDGSTGQYL